MTQVLKVVSVALLLVAVLPLTIPNDQAFLAIVVCASSVLAIRQAIRAKKYSWVLTFVVLAALFNPIAPVARTESQILLLNWVCLATFLFATGKLKIQPVRAF